MNLVTLKPYELPKSRGDLEFSAICHYLRNAGVVDPHPIFIYLAYLVCEEDKMCLGE